MPGSIRKRGRETWEVRTEDGRDPVTGKRRFRYEYVRGTKKQAEQALVETLHRRDTGMDVQPSKISVGEFLERWLRDYAEVTVAPATLQRYRQIVGRLIPLIGQVRLQALRPAHVQAAYRSLLGDDLAHRTVLHHHRVLRQALQHAVQWQFITFNPAAAVKPPRAQPTEMRALDPVDVHRLLDGCDDEEFATLISLAVATGMRLGELLGLRWADCDFDGGTLHLARAAQYLPDTGVTLRTPKAPRSRRSIALSPDTIAVLRQHRARQLEARLALGSAYRDQGLVFATVEGDPIPPYRISGRFSTLVRRVGLEPLRFHDLRHTAATLMLRAGVHPKIVSERLGHATVAITLDTYSHVMPDMQRGAAAVVDVLLARP